MGIQVGQPIGNKIFLDSDLVIGIGNRFSDRHTGDLATYCKDRKFIHINIEPSQIGMVFEPELGIVSDAKLATEALIAEVKAAGVQPINPARAAEISKLREELARKTDYDCSPIMPHRVFQEVNEALMMRLITRLDAVSPRSGAASFRRSTKPESICHPVVQVLLDTKYQQHSA